jgi:hypothetical protein
MLEGSERVGFGHLVGPEDIAYDPSSGVFYTGCADGWINRVTVNDSVVHKWINTGGRPLGIAVGRNNELIVADAAKVGTLCADLLIFVATSLRSIWVHVSVEFVKSTTSYVDRNKWSLKL